MDSATTLLHRYFLCVVYVIIFIDFFLFHVFCFVNCILFNVGFVFKLSTCLKS